MPTSTPLRAALGLALVLLAPALALLPAPRPAPGTETPAPPAGALHLHWVREEAPRRPAWPDQPKLPFDAAYDPVVAGGSVLLAGTPCDGVTAVAADTGAVRWRFVTDGPVRFAPAVWGGRAYAVSDDGHLYCLDIARGRLLWKFRGAPSGRKVLGNERLISTWPARGAPAVVPEAEGATVYFAAGIWPFMGVFLHALDARTGEVRWSNGGDGSIFIKQPHQADAFAGVGPQGALVAAGDRLLVPGGRSVPACYDRHSGRLLHFRLADNSKIGGGPDVAVGAGLFVNGGAAFDLPTGEYLGLVGEPALLDGATLYAVLGGQCRAYDLTGVPRPKPTVGKKVRRVLSTAWLPAPKGAVAVPRKVTALAKDGRRLYVGAEGEVLAFDLPLGSRPRPAGKVTFAGTPARLTAAAGRLLVSTRQGRVYSFGKEPRPTRTHPLGERATPPADGWAARAENLLRTTGVRDGYAVAWGVGSGRLVEELARASDLRLIVVEPEAGKADAFRERLIAAGLYGHRVHVLPGGAADAQLPPYLCSLMVSEDGPGKTDARFLSTAFASLRPFGGVLSLPATAGAHAALAGWMKAAPEAEQAKLSEAGGLSLLTRPGALPGSADWTHEHADAANTRVSRDRVVKAPLGLLWFGGPGHHGILPRHGHGPQPQVVDGRLFLEGVDKLRAIDIYTGRLLWEASLPGVGKAYDNLAHQPGANGGGSNYVSTRDGVYVAHGGACVRLDPATGRELSRFRLPPMPGEKKAPDWAYLNVCGDYLVGGANPAGPAPKKAKGKGGPVSSSLRLTVLDRKTGRALWSATARAGFRHNGVCLGGGRLYAIDRVSDDHQARLRRLGEQPETPARLVAFDLRTGKELWSSTRDVFGTWLSYSEEHDVLVEAGLVARDTLIDEADGMRAWSGAKGKVLWHKPSYFGPAMLRGDKVLKMGDMRAGTGSACELLTGKPVLREDPLTGRRVPWTWTRTYGCTTPAASEHLVTFRSGAAGYFDLGGDGGTGNLGGFRSSCTNNLIVAGGVLTAPDYTRTCTCSYQNQCSVGLVHLPEAEMWTFFGKRKVEGRVRRVGVNLGAPGNRRAEGTLWLEHPPVGGPSPRLAVTTAPAAPRTFRLHSSEVRGDGLKWVAGSGVRGLTSVAVPLAGPKDGARAYTVRLHFLEPDALPAGRRAFDVALQGKTVLRGLDIAAEAGGARRPLVKEFKGVQVGATLTVTLTPDASAAVREAVLSGVEVVAEGW